MKYRKDFVTNSSSSSFIVTNNTNKTMTSCQFAAKMFENCDFDFLNKDELIKDFGYSVDEVIASAKDKFLLPPGSSMEIECFDDYENLFETYIHKYLDGWYGDNYVSYLSDDISVKFHESHH